jgi:hypothetical protein
MTDDPDRTRRRWKPLPPFARGFLTALAVVGGLWCVSALGASGGGQVAISPDGKNRLDISTDLDPKAHAPYTIEMSHVASGDSLRRVELHLSAAETTEGLRNRSQVIRWNPQSDFAEIQFGKKPVLRVYAP